MTSSDDPVISRTTRSSNAHSVAFEASKNVAHRRSPLLMAVVAAVMLVSGVGNYALTSGFPISAPVERFLNEATSLALVLGAIALGILAAVFSRAAAGSRPVNSWDPLAIVGVVLTGVAFVIWLVLGGGVFVFHLITGHALRYMDDVNGIFWAGGIWVMGLVFGSVGYRRGVGRSNVLSIVAVSVGLLLIFPTIASAVIYALDLSA